ncbi:MAG: competence/damage-inducible protein A [Nitrospirales bacterium]|nr:competence/damage-inducible protein A [Nitrospirales bacterium]
MKKKQENTVAMAHAEIIAIGTELVFGGRADTNSIFLAEQLATIGIRVRQKTVVCDEIDDIGLALSQAVSRTPMIIMTGGLGPTVDDLTRQAVAQAMQRPLRRNTLALHDLQAQLVLRGKTLMPMQRRQAMLPAGSVLLKNSVGTAPGFFFDWHSCRVFVLPGVPYEMRTMFANTVMPVLTQHISDNYALQRHVLHTCGLPESDVEIEIRPLLKAYPYTQVGLRASPLGVSLTFLTWVRSDDQLGSTPQIQSLLEKVRNVLGSSVYGYDEETMEMVVGRELTKHGLRLAVAESCTGGLIGHRLTQIPGSSGYIDRGMICYSNQAKAEWLGVSPTLLKRHGAVSEQVAAAMAKGIRRQAETHVGLSVTGIAGPDGGTKTKPVGLVYIGLNAKRDSQTHVYRFHGDRESIKLRASQAALDMLRRWLEARHCDIEEC